ncbi:DNA double-strand break repair nuclease NurA [Candidatus Woesearchaeota archaeon]|nr:DNA double-strand break repair nuclease NurA [Candidatus Woesearchaeota archaeon]
MKKELVEKTLKPLDDFINRETAMLTFSDEKGFLPVPIKKEHFHELDLFGEAKEILAIDGGNQELLGAANFSLQFIRAAAVFYKGKRLHVVKKEFFALITADARGKVQYKAEIIGDQLFDKEVFFQKEIKTLSGESEKLEINAIGNIIRRYAELKLAAEVLKEDCLIIMDGSLQVKYPAEFVLMRELVDHAKEKKADLGFLSKTCRLLTKNSSSLSSALHELGPKGTWHYHPVYAITDPHFLGEMHFVKLHPRTDYVFRLELARHTLAKDFILSLVQNSSDPIFYGYPYCLIEADRVARVSNKEKNYLRTLFLSKTSHKDKLKYLLASMNAHDILDSHAQFI